VEDEALIDYMCIEGKKRLDAINIGLYNVNEISLYAKTSYLTKRYDEVYVEYRRKKFGW